MNTTDYKKKHNVTHCGFSLVELMVSLTIFSILMVVSTGTLLTLIDVNAKAQALSSSATNLSFALDSITREVRTGHYYYCRNYDAENDGDDLPQEDTMQNQAIENPGDCTESDHGNSIAFIRDRDVYKVGYRLKNGAIEQRIQSPGDGSYVTDWESITSSDVVIDTFDLVVTNTQVYGANGTGSGAEEQPTVVLHIEGHVNNGLETDTDFSIQTLITQRRLDQV